jgi:putative NADH-flavin reductase
MNLLIFGSTGGTGRELVKQALAQKHQVAAFARNPAALEIRGENLRVVQGDISNYASVERSLEGQEVVLSALGSPTLKKNTILSDGTRNIIQAMEKAGVKRLIFESSIGVGDSIDHVDLFFKWFFMPLVVRHVFADKEIQERSIKESSLDWVIVRPGRLTNGPRTNLYRRGTEINEKPIGRSISRADVAAFMLEQVTDDAHLHRTPGISY